MQLDRFDARLLVEVQRNNRVHSDDLAEKVGLSPSAVQRRLKNLRKIGVIESDIAILNPKVLGQSVTMVVLVSLEREWPDVIDRFKVAVRDDPNVVAGYLVTGDADFVVVVTTEDVEHYEDFTRRFFHTNPDVRSFKTMVVLNRVKASLAVPIDLERFNETK